ncbi:MAG TPA: SurA N-terminal domain-containing protein [Acidocella sp.]|jgi:peptidyl-prolyl cis-trans isomerase D|nr:SurA N-terminal domain-containing protein [Acidocella sp.]
MLVSVRKLLENWIARAFFALLVLVFVFWGISNVVTMIGSNTAVAEVAGQPVDISVVQRAYQAALAQAQQSGQGQPDLAAREQLAETALTGVLRERVLGLEEKRLGVAVPDAVVRQQVDQIPAFLTNGVFDKNKFAQVLEQNNTTPDQFVHDLTAEVAGQQLVVPLIAGAAPSKALVNQIFSFISEQRFAQMAQIPVAAQPQPAPPADAVLQRYWRNHPAQFTAPEYRKIQLVVLSPALLAPNETVPQTQVDADYARVAAANPSVPLRSVQVIAVGNLAASSQLEAAWRKGASWAQIQAMAKRFGANPVEMDGTQENQIPTPSLATAVFAAPQGRVVGPIAGPEGMFLFKVTNISAQGPDEATLKAQIVQQLQLQRAQAEVASNVNALQDALAGQTPLDRLPANLGLVAVEGTLDANGDTPTGVKAPLPGNAALQAAVLKAAFAASPHQPAQLINGPDGGYFALTVNSVTPPAQQPYEQVRNKVLADWTHDELVREAEIKAADLYHKVNSGQKLTDAAQAAGDQVSLSAAFTRNAPATGQTTQMQNVMFSLKLGQATMLQTGTGFTVATLAKIVKPTPQQDPTDYNEALQSMTKSLQNDVGGSFLAGLQLRDKVTINQKLFSQIYQ